MNRDNKNIEVEATTYKGHTNLSPWFVTMMKEGDTKWNNYMKELRSSNKKPQTEVQYQQAKHKFYRRFYPEEIDKFGNIKERKPLTKEQYEEAKQKFYRHYNRIKLGTI